MLFINNRAFFSQRLGLLFVCACVLVTNAATSQVNNRSSLSKVVIDAGHGGKDPGARGRSSNEKDITLAVALKLGSLISSSYKDVKVIYTRDKDVFIPLDERSAIANKHNANLFISIHVNSNKSHTPYGAETYVMGLHKSAGNFEVAATENAAIVLEDDYNTKYEGFNPRSAESYIIFSMMQSNHLGQSLNFAQMVQNEFGTFANRSDRGVKQAGFLVLWKTSMPSILVELGFISNANEEAYLKSEKGQDELAEAIFRSFTSYKRNYETTTIPLNVSSDSSSNQNDLESKNEKIISNTEIRNTNVVFKIQISASKDKPLSKKQIQSFSREIEEIKIGNVYKYTVGSFMTLSDAEHFLRRFIKNKHRDAFIIAFDNGKLISVKDASDKIRQLSN